MWEITIRILIDLPAGVADKLDSILTSIDGLKTQVSHMDDRITKLIADFDKETTDIATRIDSLITAGASGASASEIVAALQPISDRLKILGTNPALPIPPQV